MSTEKSTLRESAGYLQITTASNFVVEFKNNHKIGRVSYTKNGRPYQARTNIIPAWRQPKKGSRGMYTIITCHTPKGLLVQARRQKSQKH